MFHNPSPRWNTPLSPFFDLPRSQKSTLSQDEGDVVKDRFLKKLMLRVLENQTDPPAQFRPG